MFKFLNFFIRKESHQKKGFENNSDLDDKTSQGLRNKDSKDRKEEHPLFI